MYFVILGDSIALPWCIGFLIFGCLVVFLRDCLFWGKPLFWCGFILWIVFGYFSFMNGHFMDFLILGDSIDLPQCMNFKSLGGIRVS